MPGAYPSSTSPRCHRRCWFIYSRKFTVLYRHWFSLAAAEFFSVHISRHISVRSFHTLQRGSFVAPRTMLSYSYYCFSSSSVRCGRCVVRVLSLVVAHIFIKCYNAILPVHRLEVFAARLLMRQWRLGTEGSCPAQILTYLCVTSAQ